MISPVAKRRNGAAEPDDETVNSQGRDVNRLKDSSYSLGSSGTLGGECGFSSNPRSWRRSQSGVGGRNSATSL